MSENVHRMADGTMAPVNYDANVDYVITEYMERLGTRLNILETELKYAWRALDLLSQEYIKMWERLEKLEGLLYEQQSVISQLLDFYTTGGCRNMGAGATAGELEVIREILGNGTVEDGLEEGQDVSRTQELELEELHVPDEAFYRSLNQAYREDLGGQSSHLGMIWEEKEETEENNEKKIDGLVEGEEVFSALDYKDYRGNSPCVSEQDIAQLSRIDSIDHVAIEKLNELDRLSSKLQQDSDNIKQLQRKLLESPLSMSQEDEPKDDPNWSFSNSNQNDLLILKTELPNFAPRPSSRLSITDSVIATDNEVAEVLAGGLRGGTPTSPRRVASCSAPFTTVTGRLAYSAAVQNIDSKNPFYSSLVAASYEAIPCSTPSIFNARAETAPSPSLSIRTRQDGYIATNDQKGSPSPPPPAPEPNPVFLNTEPVPQQSIKSPKSSPKRKNVVKSDSGLSSMSGWSSIEKSPGSPKINKGYHHDNTILPGGHHLSAFTTVKSPCSLETSEGYGNFVPAPAPASDINVSPRRKKHTKANSFTWNDQPAIYSVAGSNRETYTSVYTSNSADYITQTINYPDLVEPYENNELQRTTSSTSDRRRSLSRMFSTSNGDGVANHEGYKTAMQRTMFPTGNITDALSYYPTSTRYDEYNEAWLNPQEPQESVSPCSSMRSTEPSDYNQSPYLDQRRIYENQDRWNQRQEIPYLELDLRNRNVPEYVVQQNENKFFDPSSVIITQSGYITINSDTIDTSREEKKKFKRGNTLKSAMSSVSHWLPDLHLTKRHRSYSLPSGVRREDLSKSKSNVGGRKKKKNAIVSTVSGILQKAKRKSYFHHHTQSLSDPEQSENEWVLQRASSVVSEDSYSMFEGQAEGDLFAKVSKPKLEEPQVVRVSPPPEEEASGGSASSSIFPTIGETKKSSESEKSDETVVTESKMVVVVGGASMEFAVSRALGKYRQQKQTSLPDDLSLEEQQGVVIEEIVEEPPEKLIEQVSTESEVSHTEPLPRAQNRYLPKHQQSLEIPGHKEDDDSRSTHSWRSTSRVSSRRQSTEDSIDSEDEWYCYELRKLEEMERQSLLETEMGETLKEEPELEEEYEPFEEVKERMSFVLRELRMKAKIVEGVLDESDNNLHTLQEAKNRERKSIHLEEAHMLFDKIAQNIKEEEEDEVQEAVKEEEHSSGETSGPDSPQQSENEEEFARCHVTTREDEQIEEASAIPEIEIEPEVAKAETKESAASKWKLLKALKERKAEEKSNQDKVEPASEKDKVSMLGMMQKFYEIHVKT